MYIGQIIILTIFSIIFLFTSFRLIYIFAEKLGKKASDLVFSIMGLTIIYGFILCVTILVTLKLNETNEKLKNQCPEYEKIENVYKLKN